MGPIWIRRSVLAGCHVAASMAQVRRFSFALTNLGSFHQKLGQLPSTCMNIHAHPFLSVKLLTGPFTANPISVPAPRCPQPAQGLRKLTGCELNEAHGPDASTSRKSRLRVFSQLQHSMPSLRRPCLKR